MRQTNLLSDVPEPKSVHTTIQSTMSIPMTRHLAITIYSVVLMLLSLRKQLCT